MIKKSIDPLLKNRKSANTQIRPELGRIVGRIGSELEFGKVEILGTEEDPNHPNPKVSGCELPQGDTDGLFDLRLSCRIVYFAVASVNLGEETGTVGETTEQNLNEDRLGDGADVQYLSNLVPKPVPQSSLLFGRD